MLKSPLKTFDSKQKHKRTLKDEKLVSQKNRLKPQTYINPFTQNNHYTRILRKGRFRSYFKFVNLECFLVKFG